jgi:hypothetical protein
MKVSYKQGMKVSYKQEEVKVSCKQGEVNVSYKPGDGNSQLSRTHPKPQQREDRDNARVVRGAQGRVAR